MAEYAGPVCRHVCPDCGGCDICCTGHSQPDEAHIIPDEDTITVPDGEPNGLDTWDF